MYRIHLDDFEGPLDLLLFFIRRDELDIFDIPIAEITDEFLGYVKLLKEIDLDGVGDFIYMASLLISIKAQMLLPQPDLEGDEEPIDPRRELVERLLEYVRFKEAAGMLETQHDRRSDRFVRGNAFTPEAEYGGEEEELELEAGVYDLVTVLRGILTRQEDEAFHAVHREKYSVEEQQAYVLDTLLSDRMVSFASLIERRSKAFIIATFLAVLELGRQKLLAISLDASGMDFYLVRNDELEAGEPTNIKPLNPHE